MKRAAQIELPALRDPNQKLLPHSNQMKQALQEQEVY